MQCDKLAKNKGMLIASPYEPLWSSNGVEAARSESAGLFAESVSVFGSCGVVKCCSSV
jgi:hypothetical protein